MEGETKTAAVDGGMRAVLVADDLSCNSAGEPKALVPLVNRPLLDYTLDLLLAADGDDGRLITEVLCVTTASGEPARRLEEHLLSSARRRGVAARLLLLPAGSTSVGDVLRHLATLRLRGSVELGDTFVLAHADVVGNLASSLEHAVAQHVKTRRAGAGGGGGPDRVLTLLMKERDTEGKRHNMRWRAEGRPAVALVRHTGRLIAYETSTATGHPPPPPLAPTLVKRRSVQEYHTLEHCRLAVCSAEVLDLCREHPDVHTIAQLVTAILGLGDLLHIECGAHVLASEEYVEPIGDLWDYVSVSRDIVARRVLPLAPDSRVGGGTTGGRAGAPAYTRGKQNIYLAEDVVLGKCVEVGRNTVIGRATVLHEGTILEESIVGERCTLGRNCNISRAHLWEGCLLEADVVVDRALLGRGVALGRGASVGCGSVLAAGVRIAAGHSVPPYTSIVPIDGAAGEASDETVVGRGGLGRRAHPPSGDPHHSASPCPLPGAFGLLQAPKEASTSAPKEKLSDSEALFLRKVVAIFRRGRARVEAAAPAATVAAVVHEMEHCRLIHRVSDVMFARGVVAALLTAVVEGAKETETEAEAEAERKWKVTHPTITSLNRALAVWLPALECVLKGSEGTSRDRQQVLAAGTVAAFCARPAALPLFRWFLLALYKDLDLLDDDTVQNCLLEIEWELDAARLAGVVHKVPYAQEKIQIVEAARPLLVFIERQQEEEGEEEERGEGGEEGEEEQGQG